MRAGVQRRPGVLGRGRTLPRILLPAQIPPKEGTRPRGDAQGGGILATEGRRRVRRG